MTKKLTLSQTPVQQITKQWSVKNMKKQLRFVLLILLCFSLVACAFAYAEVPAADQGAKVYPAGNP